MVHWQSLQLKVRGNINSVYNGNPGVYWGNIFEVKFCNVTPKDKITMMTRMGSYFIEYGRKFHNNLKRITNIIYYNM